MNPASCKWLAWTYEASMPGLKDFRHPLHVVTRPTIYRPIFTEKTLENAKLFKNLNNLVLCLELFIEACEKYLGLFGGCRKTKSFQTDPSALSEHPPLDIVYF